MKHIVLFGAGRSAGFLIDYLKDACQHNNWRLTLVDGNHNLAASRLGPGAYWQAIGLQLEDEEKRRELVSRADIVISLMPPSLHILLARDCLLLKKNLLTASYLDESIVALGKEIKASNLLFLYEMGLDPGIDHMSAMSLIHRIRKSGGNIISFKSHCGGLVAPESDDNCWHYKISWNPRNIVRAGAGGARYKDNDEIIHKSYKELFENCALVNINGLGTLACYPNRDSLAYIPVYGLEEARSFVRTTLRHPVFCEAWNAVVKAGLTDDKVLVAPALTYREWSGSLTPFINAHNRKQLAFLGLLVDLPVPEWAGTSADILQHLLESKLVMHEKDKDMIVMVHQVVYEKQGRELQVESVLIVKGEDSARTAMSKTVGLPLGIAARLILQGNITVTGLQVPVLPEIYEPVMKELEEAGIFFRE